MAKQPAPPVLAWLTFEGLSPEDALAKFLRCAKGFTEQHNHYNGILMPQEYIDAWLLCVQPAESDAQAGQNRAARKMILDYLSSWKDYDQQPEGFKKSKQWLEQAPAAEEATRALHVLASRHERNCINWDWAYTFRRALRKQAELRVKQEVEHLRQNKAPNLLEQFVPFTDTQVQQAEAWQQDRMLRLKWDPSVDGLQEPSNNCWLLDFSQETLAQCSGHLGNFVKVLDCLLQGAKAQQAGSGQFTLQPSLAVIRYAQARATIDVLVANRVFRAEIDGDHGLPEELFEHLCAAHVFNGIQLGKYQSGRLTVRFFKGFDTRQILGSSHGSLDEENSLPEAELQGLTHLLETCGYKLGADIRCPEGRFTQEGMANLKKLWDALAAAWEQRCFEYLEKPMKLRPHVAESNMDTNKWDEQKESHARENLDILLTALEDWNSKNSLQSRKVDVRLGHVTATTISLSYRQRKLDLAFELNSISNLATCAVQHAGELPILKVLLGDGLYRYHKEDTHNMLRFTCNCDGNGVMGSDLESEYLLNIKLVDAFMKGQSSECQVGGKTIQLEPCVYVWDRDSCELLLEVVKPEFAKQLRDWLKNHVDDKEPCKIKVDGTCFQNWFFTDYLRGHDPARFVFGGQPLPRLLGEGSWLQQMGVKK